MLARVKSSNMKNLVYITIIFFGLHSSLKAQSIFFGIKAGPQYSDLIGDPGDGIPRLGFHFGFVMEVEIYEQFSFQSELLYSSQGSEGFLFNEDVKLNYLNLPLMAKYYVINDFSIEAGAQVGWLLSAKTEENDETFDIAPVLNNLDTSLVFGLGYKIDNGIHFGVRYNYGLTNTGLNYQPIIRNSVLQFSVGYFFTPSGSKLQTSNSAE